MKNPIARLAALASSMLAATASADVDPTLALVAPPATLEVAATPGRARGDAPTPIIPPTARPSGSGAVDERGGPREELADWLAHYAPYVTRPTADAVQAPVR